MNRLPGWVFLVPLVGASVYALLAFDLDWWGQPGFTIDSVTGSTVLTGPLVAAHGAHLVLLQHPLHELSCTTQRGWLVPLRCAGKAWAGATAVYVGVAAAALVATALVVHGGPWQLWQLLAGPAVLGVAALTGAIAARWWPHPLVVVLVGPLFFLLGAFGPPVYAHLLRPGPVTGSLAGMGFVLSHLVVQVGTLAAVGIVLVALLLPWRQPGFRAASVGLVVTGLVATGGGGIALDAGAGQRFVPSGERASACTDRAPAVCVAPTELTFLRGTADAMQPAIRELRRLGVRFPERYEDDLPGYRPPARSGHLTWVGDRHGLSVARGAMNVARPASCSAWSDPSGPPPEAAYLSHRVIASWVLVRTGRRAEPWSAAEARWLRAARTQAAETWVRTTFEQLRLCQLDEIRLPWTVPSG